MLLIAYYLIFQLIVVSAIPTINEYVIMTYVFYNNTIMRCV